MSTKKKVLLIAMIAAGFTLLGAFLPDTGKSSVSDDVEIREEKFSGYEENNVSAVSEEDVTQKETETEGALCYIGNKKSKKFHRSECETLPYEKNREYFDDREQAVNMGYRACKNCNP